MQLTISGLRAEVQGLGALLDERYATQTKALDAAFVAAEKAVSTALDSAEKAVTKAEVATERRFESVTELHRQLSDQAGTFFTRTEGDVRLSALGSRLSRLEEGAITHLTQTEYAAQHEALRQAVDAERAAIAEQRNWIITEIGKLQGAVSNIRSRYAGVSVALGVIMSVIVVLVTVLQLVHK
jgi:hypothetical protein